MVAPARVGRAPVRAPRMLQAFSNQNYTRLWLANGLSYTSRWMQMIIVAWLVLELTDSAWYVGLVGFFSSIPMLLFGLTGGVLADVTNRQRLLVLPQIVNVATGVLLTVFLAMDIVQVWHTYVAIFVHGACWALSMPARRALLYDLLGIAGVTNAVALDTVGMNLSRMGGPGLAGALILLIGATGSYGLVTLFYALALGLLASLRIPQTAPPERRRQPLGRNLLEGLRYACQDQIILATMCITIVMNLLLFSYVPMVPVIARDVLHVDALLMGMLQAVEGLGALVGAMWIASAARLQYHGRIFWGGSLLSLMALFLFSVSRAYIASLPILLFLGLGSAGFGTMQAAIIMLAAKEDMRGRALGVLSLAIGAGPLGSVLLGAVAEAVSPVFALRMSALLGIIAMACIVLFLPTITDRFQAMRTAQPQTS